jgi:hypothetical protein
VANLSTKQFEALAREVFGAELAPYGFSASDSRRCTFWRKVSADVYHFVMPDKSLRLPQYTVNVFPHSPRFDEDFSAKFPDNLGFATDVESYLSSKGIGMRQGWFWCRTAEGFRRDFAERVRPALIGHAIPLLDQIQSLEAMARVVRRGPYVKRLRDLGYG